MIAIEPDRYPHGTIAWTELCCGDVDRQQAFYAALFGWEFDAERRARIDGRPVAGLRARADGLRGWAPFVAVEDLGALERAVIGAAGRVHGDGELEDPLGGHFFAWDGRHLDGAHGLNAPGGLAWNELWTPNVETALAFYRLVIGWNVKEQPGFGGAPYRMFAGRDRPTWTHGGIRSLEGSGPPRWMSYFEVASCHASVEGARRLGATVTLESTHVPGVGWLATAVDGEGAWFGLMQSGA